MCSWQNFIIISILFTTVQIMQGCFFLHTLQPTDSYTTVQRVNVLLLYCSSFDVSSLNTFRESCSRCYNIKRLKTASIYDVFRIELIYEGHIPEEIVHIKAKCQGFKCIHLVHHLHMLFLEIYAAYHAIQHTQLLYF